jgi:hypothetical protein
LHAGIAGRYGECADPAAGELPRADAERQPDRDAGRLRPTLGTLVRALAPQGLRSLSLLVRSLLRNHNGTYYQRGCLRAASFFGAHLPSS